MPLIINAIWQARLHLDASFVLRNMLVTKKEFIILATAAGLIILVSVIITASVIYLKIPIFGQSGEGRERSGAYYQLGQALPLCEQKLIDMHGDSIYTKTFDNLSSRYDMARNVNLIFFRLSLKRRQEVLEYQAICTVSAGSNRIKSFEQIPLSANARFRM